jgi:NAD(P)-dependent dehydrogenase (short-subunit alcohol dehydrogenase family)
MTAAKRPGDRRCLWDRPGRGPSFHQPRIGTILLDRSDSVVDIAEELATRDTTPWAQVVDPDDPLALRVCLEGLLADHGVVDIVANNAGIHPKKDGGKYLLQDIELDQWNQVLAVNPTAAFLRRRGARTSVSGPGPAPPAWCIVLPRTPRGPPCSDGRGGPSRSWRSWRRS